jgi:hypothetical protein
MLAVGEVLDVKQLILLWFLVALALALTGCHDCTLKHCTDRLEVRVIQGETAPTADGFYQLEFVWPGGESRTIDFVVSSYEGVTGVALLEDQGWPDTWPLERVENDQVYINIAPFLVQELDTEGYWDYVESPDQIELWVRSGDQLLGQETVYPEYDRYWCNDDEGNCDEQRNYRSIVTTIVDPPPPSE